MNKKILFTILGIVIVGGIAAFLFTSKSGNKSGPSASENTGGNTNTEQSAAQSASLKELLASGRSQECSFSDQTDSANTQGVIYFGSSKMRGDFTAVSSGQTVKSHMIADGTTSYIWMEGENTGFKTSFEATQQGTSNKSSQSVDVDKKSNYTCKSWSVDSSEFNLPSGVTFTEITMGAGVSVDQQGTQGTDAKSVQCAACDNLPGEQKTQCRAALSCN